MNINGMNVNGNDGWQEVKRARAPRKTSQEQTVRDDVQVKVQEAYKHSFRTGPKQNTRNKWGHYHNQNMQQNMQQNKKQTPGTRQRPVLCLPPPSKRTARHIARFAKGPDGTNGFAFIRTITVLSAVMDLDRSDPPAAAVPCKLQPSVCALPTPPAVITAAPVIAEPARSWASLLTSESSLKETPQSSSPRSSEPSTTNSNQSSSPTVLAIQVEQFNNSPRSSESSSPSSSQSGSPSPKLRAIQVDLVPSPVQCARQLEYNEHLDLAHPIFHMEALPVVEVAAPLERENEDVPSTTVVAPITTVAPVRAKKKKRKKKLSNSSSVVEAKTVGEALSHSSSVVKTTVVEAKTVVEARNSTAPVLPSNYCSQLGLLVCAVILAAILMVIDSLLPQHVLLPSLAQGAISVFDLSKLAFVMVAAAFCMHYVPASLTVKPHPAKHNKKEESISCL